jgi:hypothetical protein
MIRATSFGLSDVLTDPEFNEKVEQRHDNLSGTAGTLVPIRFDITVQSPGTRSVLGERRSIQHA